MEDSISYAYDFAAHRGTQKAGEVCEEFLQEHVDVMNMATNVKSNFC